MNNCAACDYKKHPEGGHCYMFRTEPEGVCAKHTGHKTGWPPGMLQDDERKLSIWLANRIDSRSHAREAAEVIGRAALGETKREG